MHPNPLLENAAAPNRPRRSGAPLVGLWLVAVTGGCGDSSTPLSAGSRALTSSAGNRKLVDPDPERPAPGEPLEPLLDADRPKPSEINVTRPTPADGPCDAAPPDSLWRASISDAPVHPRSDQWIASIGVTRPLNLDANHTISHLSTPVSQTPLTLHSPANSDLVPWYIPEDAVPFRPLNTQRTPRLVVLDHIHCRSYELFGVQKTDHGWEADTANAFDLRVERRRRQGWLRETEGTKLRESVHDASGASVLAGLLRVDEITSGHPIDHAVGVSVPALDRAYLPPATHGASDTSNPALPPSGARLRLRDHVHCASFDAPARPLCVALQHYGLVITSQGSSMALTGEVMDRSLYRSLAPLAALTAGDFEVVGTDDPIRYGSTVSPFHGSDASE